MIRRLNRWGTAFVGFGAAGAAAGVLLDRSGEPVSDRMERGAALGLAAAGALYAARMIPGFAWRQGWRSARFAGSHGGSLLRRYVVNMGRRFQGARASGSGVLSAAMHGFGTIGLFATAGVAAGALLDRESPSRGAVLGALAGIGLRASLRFMQGLGRVPGLAGRVLASVALAGGGAMLAGMAASPSSEFAPEPEDEVVETGVRRRLRTMNADGSIVLGAHNRR